MRLFKPKVKKLVQRRDYDGVHRALRDNDPSIRKEALEALGRPDWPGDSRSLEAVIQVLESDPDQSVRADAAQALWMVAYRVTAEGPAAAEAVDGLYRLLKNPDRAVREASLQVLPMFGDARSLDAVIRVLRNDPDGGVRSAAVMALAELGGPHAADALSEVLADETVGWYAVDALARLGDERAIDPLAARLDAPQPTVRRSAREAIQALGKPRADAALARWKAEHADEWLPPTPDPKNDTVLGVWARGTDETVYRAKARAAGFSDEDTERGDMIRYYDPPFQRAREQYISHCWQLFDVQPKLLADKVEFEESDTMPD